MQIEVTSSPSDADREVVLSGLRRLMLEQVGNVVERLCVLVRDEAGTTVGGLLGRTSGQWLYVELLWLPDALHGTGLGTRLMRDAEAEAERRGCLGVHLDTYGFQAPGFYRKLGYEVFGTIEDHPPGHTRFWMRKRFTNADKGADTDASTGAVGNAAR